MKAKVAALNASILGDKSAAQPSNKTSSESRWGNIPEGGTAAPKLLTAEQEALLAAQPPLAQIQQAEEKEDHTACDEKPDNISTVADAGDTTPGTGTRRVRAWCFVLQLPAPARTRY